MGLDTPTPTGVELSPQYHSERNIQANASCKIFQMFL